MFECLNSDVPWRGFIPAAARFFLLTGLVACVMIVGVIFLGVFVMIYLFLFILIVGLTIGAGVLFSYLTGYRRPVSQKREALAADAVLSDKKELVGGRSSAGLWRATYAYTYRNKNRVVQLDVMAMPPQYIRIVPGLFPTVANEFSGRMCPSRCSRLSGKSAKSLTFPMFAACFVPVFLGLVLLLFFRLCL